MKFPLTGLFVLTVDHISYWPINWIEQSVLVKIANLFSTATNNPFDKTPHLASKLLVNRHSDGF